MKVAEYKQTGTRTESYTVTIPPEYDEEGKHHSEYSVLTFFIQIRCHLDDVIQCIICKFNFQIQFLHIFTSLFVSYVHSIVSIAIFVNSF